MRKHEDVIKTKDSKSKNQSIVVRRVGQNKKKFQKRTFTKRAFRAIQPCKRYKVYDYNVSAPVSQQSRTHILDY